MAKIDYTIPFELLTLQHLPQVGGKNASLGEMISNLTAQGIKVPHGFATTADAFREFLRQNNLEQTILALIETLDVDNVRALTSIGSQIRAMIMAAPFSENFSEAIKKAYSQLINRIGHSEFTVAVRSSATAEDLPDASFAGQQETYLNVSGIDEIFDAIKKVFASLYNDRAIAYRAHQGFKGHEIALSAGIQQMVRSDIGASGVVFTLDTESGFDEVILITGSYGLGEMVVQGAVNPDEFYVYKSALKNGNTSIVRRILGTKAVKMIYETTGVKKVEVEASERQLYCLTDAEIEALAKQALIIEQHYDRPMDIEWGKDGNDGQIYILQARPETVKSRVKNQTLERYTLKKQGELLCEGRSIGQKIGQGIARVINNIDDMDKVQSGDVLVTDMTDPDWEPVMKRAAAIITNRGGRTCHAAIIARELGIPAVVGCGDATLKIKDQEAVTVSCAEGDTGYVYKGKLPFEVLTLDVETMPSLPVKVMLNVGNPERAFTFRSLPNDGVGLARLEFIISNTIGIHPNALLDYDKLTDTKLKAEITEKTAAYASPVAYYVERLKEGIATIASAFYPKPVIVRMSDFKSNEYANLMGGSLYEPHEENPMLGFRGASRYIANSFKAAFKLECEALLQVRGAMGLTNVEVMIPFVRTVNEAKEVIDLLAANGLRRGENGLRLIMMCELPANALLADDFLQYFDGFSIGSNDLTQLTLGLDRDSGLVAAQFDERDAAVKSLLSMAIKSCKSQGKYIGICGQGPSDHPDFAEWLLKEGIDSISLNPDSVMETCLFLAKGN